MVDRATMLITADRLTDDTLGILILSRLDCKLCTMMDLFVERDVKMIVECDGGSKNVSE